MECRLPLTYGRASTRAISLAAPQRDQFGSPRHPRRAIGPIGTISSAAPSAISLAGALRDHAGCLHRDHLVSPPRYTAEVPR